MNIKTYPQYKDSGVPWLGMIPKEWEIKRLGSAFFERKEKVSDKDYPPLSVTKNGILPQLENAAKTNDGDNRKKVVACDFVINSRSDRKGSSGLSHLTGSVSLINTVLIPFGIDGKYTHKLLKSHPFKEEFYRVGRGIVADLWSTKYSEMQTIMIPIPPLPEQNQIARYLDWKTVQIAKFIKDKKRMIELLKEQKQVIINDAVTGKIDVTTGNPYPKYKDSGVEWLGQVPEGWDVLPLKHVLKRIIDCEHKTAPKVEKSPYRVIRTSAIKDGKLILDGTYCTSKETFIEWTNRAVPKPGDIIFTREAPTGEACIVPENFHACLGQRTVLLQLINDYYPDFLIGMIYAGPPRISIQLAAKGSTVGHFNVQDIGPLIIFKPPFDEQKRICERLKILTFSIELAISRVEREIGLMQEYRDRLIADVVTGKLDVRGISVPEELEELPADYADDTNEDPDEIENEEEA